MSVQVVKLKRSSVEGKSPSTEDIALGELAINSFDGKMFFKKFNGIASVLELATTDWVFNQASNSPPPSNGTASTGVSTRYARQDHAHSTNSTNKEVLFNDNGTTAGSPDLIFDKGNAHLEIGLASGSGAICLVDNSHDELAEPGELIIYAKNIAGKLLPKWVCPDSVDTPFQAFLGGNGIRQVSPATGTSASTCMQAFGTAVTNSAGTIVQSPIAAGSIKGWMRYVSLATSNGSGSIAYHITPQYECLREGGFFFIARFGLSSTLRVGHRGFFGLADTLSAPTNLDPLSDTIRNKIGIGFDSDTGNWSLICGPPSVAPTIINLGTDFPINNTDILELALYAPPSGQIGYKVENLTTSKIATGSISTNLPSIAAPLAVRMWITNNAVNGPSTFILNKWYLETDY